MKNVIGSSLYLLVLTSLILTTAACTRPEGGSSEIQISIPGKMLASKNSAQSPTSADSLVHVTINVTGDGLLDPIILNWDSCGGDCPAAKTPPSSFPLIIPSGTRTVQVLAVYQNSTTNTMSFYYGDLTQGISGSAVTLTIPILQVGSGTIISGNVGGRYLTGADSGPTGLVDVKYQPTGKPALIVDSAYITNGWFNFFMLSGASLKYVVRNSGLVLWGGEVSLDSPEFDPANDMNQRVKAFVPVHTESRWQNGIQTYTTRDASISVWGYWGSAATGKYVCLSGVGASTTDIKQYASSNLASAPALTIAHTATAGAATPSTADLVNTVSHLTYIKVKGGATMTGSCGGYSDTDANRLVNFLKIIQKNIESNGHDSGPGFKGIFIADTNGNAVTMAGNPKTITGNILPGVELEYDQIHLYTRAGSEEFRLDYPDCQQISSGLMGFSLAGSSAITSRAFSISTSITPAQILSGMTAVLCPAKNGIVASNGQFLERWAFQTGTYVELAGTTGSFSASSCFQGEVNLKTYSGSTTSGSGSIPISSTIAGVDFFASEAACISGTPTVTTVTLSSSNHANFFFKTSSTAATGTIALGNFMNSIIPVDGNSSNLEVKTSTGSVSQVLLSVAGTSINNASHTFTSNCTPMKVSLLDSSGNYVSPGTNQSLSANVSDNPGGGTATGAIYDDPACMSPNIGSPVTWTGAVGSKFVYVFGALTNNIDNTMTVLVGTPSATFNALIP